jgi:hypothetical protein
MRTADILVHGLANHSVCFHAINRMAQRGIAPQWVELVLRYGRLIHARGLIFRVIGRKEVARFATQGIHLACAEGIHVLVKNEGTVLTVYRNHDLRKIRPHKRTAHHS